MKLIIFGFIISISLHFLLFNYYKTNKTIDKKVSINQEQKYTNIKYVKLKKEVKKKSIKKAQEKKKILQKITKETAKKEVSKKKKILKKKSKAKITRKVSKKLTKLKKPLPRKKRTLFKKPISKQKKLEKRKTIQEKTLEDFLSQEEPIDKKILSKIERLYGREFQSFTSIQKAFIKKHLQNFQEITQGVLTRLGYPRLAAKLRIAGVNTVEFIFYPNGDIKNLKLTSSSGYVIFDKYTLELIEIAYKDYPKPKSATKLKFNVQYRLY